jgi:hypothetical protein
MKFTGKAVAPVPGPFAQSLICRNAPARGACQGAALRYRKCRVNVGLRDGWHA